MNAIGGVYIKEGSTSLYQQSFKEMMKSLGKYSHEGFADYWDEKVYFGCFKNTVTHQSLLEVLPLTRSGTTIVADAIIDNRKHLYSLLDIGNDISDSELILRSYLKWGKDCIDYLVGDFAFGIWDHREQRLFLARDQVGKRVLYYYQNKDFLAFSTLINPIFKLPNVKKEPNEQYIADFLGYTAVTSQIVPDLTIYKDIYQISPGEAITIDSRGFSKNTYWKFEKKDSLRFKSRQECNEAFLEVFGEAVKCRLNSVGNIGIYLSGGLDSTSVGALAAKELTPKQIHGFTQVPMEGYVEVLKKGKLADEREYVDALCQRWDNIIPHYIDSKGVNPLSIIDEKLDILEQPYKTFENSHWMHQILEKAKAYDIKVMLDGQSGNGSISWGSNAWYLGGLLRDLRLGEYIGVSRFVSKINNRNYLRQILSNLYPLVPYWIKKLRYKGEKLLDTLSPINKDFYRELDMENRFKANGIDCLFLPKSEPFNSRNLLTNTAGKSHLGVFETKASLNSSICRRDPTRDKRVIEFCFDLDERYFLGEDGTERYLIRSSMEGLLPDKIRLNTKERGRQAADWGQRVAPIFSGYRDEIDSIGGHTLEARYLDIKGIKQKLKAYGTIDPSKAPTSQLRCLIRALIFSRFIRSNF